MSLLPPFLTLVLSCDANEKHFPIRTALHICASIRYLRHPTHTHITEFAFVRQRKHTEDRGSGRPEVRGQERSGCANESAGGLKQENAPHSLDCAYSKRFWLKIEVSHGPISQSASISRSAPKKICLPRVVAVAAEQYPQSRLGGVSTMKAAGVV